MFLFILLHAIAQLQTEMSDGQVNGLKFCQFNGLKFCQFVCLFIIASISPVKTPHILLGEISSSLHFGEQILHQDIREWFNEKHCHLQNVTSYRYFYHV